MTLGTSWAIAAASAATSEGRSGVYGDAWDVSGRISKGSATRDLASAPSEARIFWEVPMKRAEQI